MAESEFRTTGSDDDWSRVNPVHDKAKRYFRHLPQDELRVQLEGVYAAHRKDSMAACGAAYVLALHGVDVDKNIDRLAKVRQSDAGATDAVSSIPEAFADIALRQHSSRALVALVEMATDGDVAEQQAAQFARVLSKDLFAVARILGGDRRFALIAQEVGLGQGEGA